MNTTKAAPVAHRINGVADLHHAQRFAVTNQHPLHPQPKRLLDGIQACGHLGCGAKFAIRGQQQVSPLPTHFFHFCNHAFQRAANVGAAAKGLAQKVAQPFYPRTVQSQFQLQHFSVTAKGKHMAGTLVGVRAAHGLQHDGLCDRFGATLHGARSVHADQHRPGNRLQGGLRAGARLLHLRLVLAHLAHAVVVLIAQQGAFGPACVPQQAQARVGQQHGL